MYKVGDKVRVKNNLHIGGAYGNHHINSEMFRNQRKLATIIKVLPYSYWIDLDSEHWNWTSEMFENNSSNKLFKLM